MAFGVPGGTKSASTSNSTGAPECRLVVPDTAFLVRDSDSGGQGLPVIKPYVPAAPLVLVPPPAAPVEKQGPGDKDKGGASGSGKAGAGTDAAGKPAKKVSVINVLLFNSLCSYDCFLSAFQVQEKGCRTQ